MLVAITVILRRFLAESADHFWQPAEFENVTNSYLENLTHLQNPGHLLLTKPSVGRLHRPHINVHMQIKDAHRVPPKRPRVPSPSGIAASSPENPSPY